MIERNDNRLIVNINDLRAKKEARALRYYDFYNELTQDNI